MAPQIVAFLCCQIYVIYASYITSLQWQKVHLYSLDSSGKIQSYTSVLRLFRQQLVTRRDSRVLEFFSPQDLCGNTRQSHYRAANQKTLFFSDFPSISPGDQLLTKEPDDSAYETREITSTQDFMTSSIKPHPNLLVTHFYPAMLY